MVPTFSMRTRHLTSRLGLALGFLALSSAAASAHAVVLPGDAPTGAFQRYVLRVPNERAFATLRVAITFPAGVRVISFDVVPGWTLETTAGAAEGSVSAAVWT